MSIKVGINGFGRIGKCLLLQLLDNSEFSIKCINVIGIKINEIEEYLRYDSTHHYNKNFEFSIISDYEFKINNHQIRLFSDRDPKNLPWTTFDCNYLFECTGSFLTTEKCSSHNVPYIILSSPAKDLTPTFIYGVNHDKYSGETIVSGSSCTTNCLTPMLKILNDTYKITDCVFTTIHATTASQYTVDIVDKKVRTSRSILGNIIPHTTGASSSVYSVLPELFGLVNGTSLRVPVINCSLVDLNIQLENTQVKLNDIIDLIKNNKYYSKVYMINDKKLVSCDFITTTTPTILDTKASIDMGNGKFKFILWYDNEWSYSTQLIRLCKSMWEKNTGFISYSIPNSIQINENKYYINNIDFFDKNVVLRLDLNVPIKNSSEITDDFRIVSAIPTIKTILNGNPSKLIIVSHFGRPKGIDNKYSLKIILDCLSHHINSDIEMLYDGVSQSTLNQLYNSDSQIFLLENIRFYNEETNYDKSKENLKTNEFINIYSMLGDIFISDAFGCTHRSHLSICGIKEFETIQSKTIGYGHLIYKEINYLSKLIDKNKKILCIIGGNKIADKLPIINSFKNLPNVTIFVCGGLAKHFVSDNKNIIVMEDGWGNTNIDLSPLYISDIKNTFLNVYDIGPKSKSKLFDIVLKNDVVFWNGSLGVIENNFYKCSSLELINFLENNQKITTIIGGGETGSIVSNKNSNIYVSTGGGALLEYLEQKFNNGTNIPGIEIFE